jgi:putative alpha-1,2-mannosidase
MQAISATTCYGLIDSKAKPALAAMLPAEKMPRESEDLTRYVNIRIGTGVHGHTYPGATVPFGAVQLSPDTYTEDWDWCSGYCFTDTSIMGFSHNHLSGTGCGDMLDVLLMPNVGEVKWEPGTRENPEEGYRSMFSHADEQMEPECDAVPPKDRNVYAELTATERTGLHRYTFSENETTHFILDFAHSYDDPVNPVSAATLRVAGGDTLTGNEDCARCLLGT